MTKRPISVLVVACLYIATGILGLAAHLTNVNLQGPFPSDLIWIVLVELLAIVAGVYMLRGRNWARWLAIAWIAFHVVLSAFHSWFEMSIHSLLCAAFAYLLFRQQASEYFGGKTQAT